MEDTMRATGSRSATPTPTTSHLGSSLPSPSASSASSGSSGSSSSSHLHHANSSSNDGDSRFDCNVCLSAVEDPVVTLCGHLYCWSCLYRWLTTGHSACPVCKAGVTKENVIPLYGRGSEQVDPRTKRRGAGAGGDSGGATDVPGRPAAQRPEATPHATTFIGGAPAFMGGLPFNAFGTANHYTGGGAGGMAGGGGMVSFSAGFGFFPSLFGLQFQSFTSPAPASTAAGATNASTADEAQQAFLSKLLLMLGIFTLGVLVFC